MRAPLTTAARRPLFRFPRTCGRACRRGVEVRRLRRARDRRRSARSRAPGASRKFAGRLPAGAAKRPLEQARHDLAQDRGVVLRLDIALAALDAERLEIAAQPRQRALVQEAGQVVGAVGQQLAAPEPDEEIEILALRPRSASVSRGGFRQRRMREAERARDRPRSPASALENIARRARAAAAPRAAHIPARAPHRPRRVAAAHARRRDRGAARPARRRWRLDREHPLGRNALPVRNRGLGNAYFSRKLADAAGGVDRFLEPGSRIASFGCSASLELMKQ